MNPILDDSHVDEFFDWLRINLSENEQEIKPIEADAVMLELAWQAAQAQQAYAINHGLPFTQFVLPKAAADGSPTDAPREYTDEIKFMDGDKAVVGEYVLSREDFPTDAEKQLLRFKCSQEFLPKYQGCAVQVIVEGQKFDFGVIDRRGSAKAIIPRTLDLSAGFQVSFGERKG